VRRDFTSLIAQRGHRLFAGEFCNADAHAAIGQCNDERDCRAVTEGMPGEYVEVVERPGALLQTEY